MKKLLTPTIFQTLRSYVLLILITQVFLYHNSVNAAADIHFSKHRLIFDDSHRKDSLILTNSGLNLATCKMSTVNFIMSEKGPTKLADAKNQPANSASNLLRFSPRRVTINSKETQTVRITSRRRPNIQNDEFMSYLKIDCEDKEESNKTAGQISIKPKFIYYIPLQVRVGKLTASTDFSDIKLNKIKNRNTISFTQTREGKRSVVGDITITEKSSNTILGELKNIVIYSPFNKKTHTVPLSSAPNGLVEILFHEGKENKGDISVKVDFST